MTRRQQTLRLALLCLLALLAAGWLFFEPAERAGSATSPLPDAAPTAEAETARVQRPATAGLSQPLPPLPPRDARVQDVLPALQARADAGDGIAACRLSVELMRCQIHARKSDAKLASLERNLTRLRVKDNPRVIAAIELELARALATDSSCALLPKGLVDRAQHYLRAAALAGEPESRFRYASGAGFDDTGDFDYLLTPAFDQWRREAEAMMQESMRDGRPETTLVLAFAYANDLGLLAGLVPDDPARARAHLALAKRIYGDSLAAFPFPLPQTDANASAAEVASAEAQAAQWHQAHFGGRQYDFLDLMVKQSHPWGEGSPASAAVDLCSGPESSDHE